MGSMGGGGILVVNGILRYGLGFGGGGMILVVVEELIGDCE